MSNWVQQTGGLPKYIKRMARHIEGKQWKGKPVTKGMSIAIAKNACERMCATGDTNFPGMQQVGPKSRAEACAAVAEWNAKRAAAKADNRS